VHQHPALVDALIRDRVAELRQPTSKVVVADPNTAVIASPSSLGAGLAGCLSSAAFGSRCLAKPSIVP
jgi:hypothetical protein